MKRGYLLAVVVAAVVLAILLAGCPHKQNPSEGMPMGNMMKGAPGMGGMGGNEVPAAETVNAPAAEGNEVPIDNVLAPSAETTPPSASANAAKDTTIPPPAEGGKGKKHPKKG